MTKSYITTPIYYVNAAPHLGHAHTTVMCDIMTRNRKANGVDTRLSTGCDEHGQKNQESAEKLGMDVMEYLDLRSSEFKKAFDLLDVDYDYFVRTTRPFHKEQVAAMEQKFMDAGLIIEKQYTGIYCKGCEQFKTESDLNDEGRCVDHPNMDVEEIDEKNYFFPLEPFRQRLLDHIEANPDFVQPPKFLSELKNMLAEPLEDLCISRPKSRVSLGVTLPFDEDFVTYVWFDALINYLTNLGWPGNDYQDYWSEVEHVIGKDILKTHGVYWPIILMGMGETLPKRISVHGHWLGSGGVKMSKSLGNVVDPLEIVEKFGADALRYYLARHMRAENDSQISVELIQGAYNGELGNKVGNLLSRAAKFSVDRFDGKIPTKGTLTAEDEAARAIALKAAQGFAEVFALTDIPARTEALVQAADELNNYFTAQAPWKLIKDPETADRAQTVLYVTLDSLRVLLEAFRQIIPTSADKALAILAAPVEEGVWSPELDRLEEGGTFGEVVALFPRVT
ncbi:methionine--tRNA ligase [Halocynthiibacter sp. C4]|uniref:methionine--tRNA ligase n=1 Tax=Halocynthiibacter sp. C4 TaxID=2992758 RepID=UPI00237BD373|nr:methionine--tRNA ligase [Halocynthiibacter sp. C4]MDE0590608.1 methionine--tRNA ligase [Halocynthiibacter sp. C4]